VGDQHLGQRLGAERANGHRPQAGADNVRYSTARGPH
jgi:hypothetical protein